ncbi:MAG: Fur family transcriptional regulator [Microbacterium sp.]
MTTQQRTHRSTPQKEAVHRALEAADGFVTAQQLHHRLTEGGYPVGLATVYRQLNALTEAGAADAIPAASGQLFRACAPNEHHHHLVCEECGTAAEIDLPDESWILAEARRLGFAVSRHVVEVFGKCARCQLA